MVLATVKVDQAIGSTFVLRQWPCGQAPPLQKGPPNLQPLVERMLSGPQPELVYMDDTTPSTS